MDKLIGADASRSDDETPPAKPLVTPSLESDDETVNATASKEDSADTVDIPKAGGSIVPDALASETLISDKITSISSNSKNDANEGESPDDLLEKLSAFFQRSVGLDPKKKEHAVERILTNPTVDAIIDYVKSGKCKNIIALVGAGISTSAGIPDFRSPNTGLYANLQKYNLPRPESMFDIEYFSANPKPFYSLAKELYPGKFSPTPSHYFLRLLHEKKLLKRVYSQNIDMLERMAGIPGDKIVEAHGSFHKGHCLSRSCHKEYTLDWLKEKIFADVIPKCEKCDSFVKPDIVFFGESLPTRFFTLVSRDFIDCDLLIVMGTSLTVQPFASLVDNVASQVPRLFINMTKCGEVPSYMRLLGMQGGFDFDSEANYRDVMWMGPSDEKVTEFAEKIGWKKDLDELLQSKPAIQL